MSPMILYKKKKQVIICIQCVERHIKRYDIRMNNERTKRKYGSAITTVYRIEYKQ